MKVTLDFESHTCRVEREATDPRFTGGGWSLPESGFLHHVKQELIKQGYDVIKKRMWRDGHMVDDTMQYIRTRSYKGAPGEFAIWNSDYAIYDAGLEFNRRGVVTLRLEV